MATLPSKPRPPLVFQSFELLLGFVIQNECIGATPRAQKACVLPGRRNGKRNCPQLVARFEVLMASSASSLGEHRDAS